MTELVLVDGNFTLFIDGEAVPSGHQTGGWPELDISNSTPLLIGSGQQCCFTGAIGDLRIYDEALSKDSILEIRNID